MRKHQQKQILDLLETMALAQSEGSFADCQDGAIAVGEFIEQIKGEGTETVALLEEYCELIYKAYTGEIGIKPLRKQLVKVKNSVNFELKLDRTEMVFLSYKASMHDSIESIYLAAKEDPDCDAYWIPIPYCSRNPDGTVKETHFEGADCYPDYIECIDWQKYDIEERHPDVIFTFSAYDGYNYVSSVHPEFYCERLKNLTDCLVYIPYFVSGESSLPEHFATLQGCIHADLVVLESEAIREQYIEHYSKAYGNKMGDPKKKFVALGSPKYDKVLTTTRENAVLPKEWREIVKDKKVILYNTSIGAILQGGEQYLKKLQHVLQTFESCNDVALWWRPHPLSESTYESMRPQLAAEYKALVAQYKKDGWGIYDDTPDMHRSIAWSDAYYGDGSSLVPMYVVTGKPVVIQNVSQTESEVLLRFADFAVDDDGGVWAFELLMDGLFKIDFKKNSTQLVALSGSMPKHLGKVVSFHRYIKISCFRDTVVCFPFYSDNIFVFDRKTDTSQIIPLDRDYMLPFDYEGFALRKVAEYQGKAYAFGSLSKAVIVYDAATSSVRYDTMLFDRIGLLIDDKSRVKYPLYMSGCSSEGKVTLLMRSCGHLISYDLLTQEAEFIISNPILSKCVFADFDGQYYWLVAENYNKLIKWSPETNEAVEYDMADDGFKFCNEIGALAGITDCGSYLLLYPGYGNEFLQFDKDTLQFSKYSKLPMPDVCEKILKYDSPKKTGNKVFAFNRHDFTMYELDKLTGDVTPHKFRLDKADYETFFSGYFDNFYSAIFESTNGSIGKIANFFSVILAADTRINQKQRDSLLEHSVNKDGAAGKTIYEYVREV